MKETRGARLGWDFRLTRRSFLVSLMAIGATCKQQPGPPLESPIYRGKFSVRRALLGSTPYTAAIPLPQQIGDFHTGDFLDGVGVPCADGSMINKTFLLPADVPAMVYYPALSTSYSTALPIDVNPVQTD